MKMYKKTLPSLLLAGTWLAGGVCHAAEEFDNPRLGKAPCLVLNQYEVTSSDGGAGSRGYAGGATLENICGRSLDVAFCFLLAEPVEGTDRACYGGTVRPGGLIQVSNPDVAARIVDFDMKWRYPE